MSAVGCCGQPPCVVATARCLVPTAQHSTHFHFLTFPLPGGGWCGLTRPAPARAPQRCTWRTLAQGSAPARSAEQPRRSVPAPPHCPVYPATATHWHHTHNFHYLLTFIGAVHGGNTVDGSAPCWGRWTKPFPEYGQYGICSQLLERETCSCSGQSYICCNILNFIMSFLMNLPQGRPRKSLTIKEKNNC